MSCPSNCTTCTGPDACTACGDGSYLNAATGACGARALLPRAALIYAAGAWAAVGFGGLPGKLSPTALRRPNTNARAGGPQPHRSHDLPAGYVRRWVAGQHVCAVLSRLRDLRRRGHLHGLQTGPQ